MNNSSGNQKPSFWDFLLSLFGGLTKPSSTSVAATSRPHTGRPAR